jgi:hypothetical protein
MTEAGHIENLRMQAHQFYRYGNFRKKQKKKTIVIENSIVPNVLNKSI